MRNSIFDSSIWYCSYSLVDRTPPIYVWNDIPFEPLCSDGVFNSCDLKNNNVIDYHIKNIAEAKIDFLIFDNTNGGFDPDYSTYYNDDPNPCTVHTSNWVQYVLVSGLVCDRIKVWNDAHSWKIRYVQAIGIYGTPKCGHTYLGGTGSFGDCIEKQAIGCWNSFANPTNSRSFNWCTLDGKPLLILFIAAEDIIPALKKWQDFTASDTFPTSIVRNFTVRFASTGQQGMYGWPAWGSDFSKSSTGLGTVIDDEVELVCPGYRSCNGSDCKVIPRTDAGKYYSQSCWGRVLANKKPRIVVISSFNDYWERTAVWPAQERIGGTLPTEDCWEDSPVHWQPDMYWKMTKSYIRRLKGLTLEPIINLLLD